MNLQVVNVKNPNSIKNTSLFAVFEGDDTTTNLHTALDPYREQVSEMQGMDWGLVSYTVFTLKHSTYTCTCICRFCKIRVFLSGDYDFLTKMYGLSGASGMYTMCMYMYNVHVHVHVYTKLTLHRETLLPLVLNPCQ